MNKSIGIFNIHLILSGGNGSSGNGSTDAFEKKTTSMSQRKIHFCICLHKKRGDMNSNKIILELTGTNTERDEPGLEKKMKNQS